MKQTQAREGFPRLSPDGKWIAYVETDRRRLFFRSADRMFAVAIDYEPTIRFGPPRLLFVGDYDSAEVGHQHYDISLDNERFLMIKHGVPDGPHEVRVVLNWSEELGSK